MKKVLPLIFMFALFCVTGCGPSAEEKEKMEQEANEAVDSMMNTLEAEISAGMDSSKAESAQEEQTVTKESEEVLK